MFNTGIPLSTPSTVDLAVLGSVIGSIAPWVLLVVLVLGAILFEKRLARR